MVDAAVAAYEADRLAAEEALLEERARTQYEVVQISVASENEPAVANYTMERVVTTTTDPDALVFNPAMLIFIAVVSCVVFTCGVAAACCIVYRLKQEKDDLIKDQILSMR